MPRKFSVRRALWLNRATSGSIQVVVTGKSLLKRLANRVPSAPGFGAVGCWLILLFTAGFFVFLYAVNAEATPIRPNIRKLVTQNQTTPPPASPARAGWDGPEMRPVDVRMNPALDPTVTLRSNKAALITAAVPDPRAVLAVIVVIFLMRALRNVQEKQKRTAAVVAIEPKERMAA